MSTTATSAAHVMPLSSGRALAAVNPDHRNRTGGDGDHADHRMKKTDGSDRMVAMLWNQAQNISSTLLRL